jgi:sigma-B regulation protein RsbU (phosphoserine phosphatase)
LISIAAVAYADYIAKTVPLGYLYILPLGIAAMFLRSEISYSLIVLCLFLHDLFRPVHILGATVRLMHNLTALTGFVLVVYAVQKYAIQRELLAKAVREQRDDLLNDVQLAGQVQRMFLPQSPPSIQGLDISGMMQPVRDVGGDYYDYIPMNDHAIQLVVADVSGKGVAAALLMSAAAAAMQLETSGQRGIADIINDLNTGLHAVSDGTRYVTLFLAQLDVPRRTLRFINSGHNPALLLRHLSGEIVSMNSSCPPLGLFGSAACAIDECHLENGDVMVFYTDGLTESENPSGDPFGTDRLLQVIRDNSGSSAEKIMNKIFDAAVDFRGGHTFNDDLTIVIVKCDFEATEWIHHDRSVAAISAA